MSTMDLADLANYYWLGKRVLTIADECTRRARVRKAMSASGDECARRATARRVSEARDCGTRVRADWIRTLIYSRAVAKKCIERSAKRGYSENRRLIRS